MLIPSDLVMELEPLKAHVETRKKPSNREHLVVTTPFRTKTRRELVKFVIGEAPINRTLAVPATRYKHTLFIPWRLDRHPSCVGGLNRQEVVVNGHFVSLCPGFGFQTTTSNKLQHVLLNIPCHLTQVVTPCIHLNMYTYCTCRCINMLFQYTHVHAPMVPRMHK